MKNKTNWKHLAMQKEVISELLAFLNQERVLENKGMKWIEKNFPIEEQCLESRVLERANLLVEIIEGYSDD